MLAPMGTSIIAVLLALSSAAAAAPANPARGTAEVARLDPRQLDERLAQAQALPIADRVQALSALFLGTAYVDYPLGEGGTGPEPQARFRLDGVDCQTYVETVLAFANARSVEQAKAVLDDLRYARQPPSFATRNHFTEAQWLPANEAKGYLRPALANDAQAQVSELVLERARWTQVSFLKRLAAADIPEGRFPIRYLPLAEARAQQQRLVPGSIILVVREADPARVVRVSHMGIVVRTSSGGLAVRHASSVAAERRVLEEPFDRYVERMAAFKKWKVAGFGLETPVDARARASAVSQAAR